MFGVCVRRAVLRYVPEDGDDYGEAEYVAAGDVMAPPPQPHAAELVRCRARVPRLASPQAGEMHDDRVGRSRFACGGSAVKAPGSPVATPQPLAAPQLIAAPPPKRQGAAGAAPAMSRFG